jgi:serine/threonine protein kinase
MPNYSRKYFDDGKKKPQENSLLDLLNWDNNINSDRICITCYSFDLTFQCRILMSEPLSLFTAMVEAQQQTSKTLPQLILAQRLHNGPPLLLIDAMKIALQICKIMEPICEQNLSYYDLRPSRVILTQSNTVLIGNFAAANSPCFDPLAKTPSQFLEQNKALDASQLTKLMQDTLAYTPPERWRGDEACGQSYIYIFGVVLYELFCGIYPFISDNVSEMSVLHSEVPAPSPLKFNAELPWGLVELILECVAKKPTERPQTFAIIAERLYGIYKQFTGKSHSP